MWIPDYLSVELGFRIPRAEFRIPKSRIPDSTRKNFPDSRIWITLHVSYNIPILLIMTRFTGLRSSRPKSYVARNFIMLNNFLASLLPFAALVSSDQRI